MNFSPRNFGSGIRHQATLVSTAVSRAQSSPRQRENVACRRSPLVAIPTVPYRHLGDALGATSAFRVATISRCGRRRCWCWGGRRRLRRAGRAGPRSSRSSSSLSWRRARCTRDFIPDTEMPSWSAACWWVWPSRSTRSRASRADGRAVRRGAAGGSEARSRVASFGSVVDGLWVGPAVGVVDLVVDVAGAVVVDDGVARRAVEPGRRVVDAFERAGGDAAHDDVLGDVGGQLRRRRRGRRRRPGCGRGSRPSVVSSRSCGRCSRHRASLSLLKLSNRTDERSRRGTHSCAPRRVRPDRVSFVIWPTPAFGGSEDTGAPPMMTPAVSSSHSTSTDIEAGDHVLPGPVRRRAGQAAARAMPTSRSPTRRSSWSCSRTPMPPRR